MGNKKKKSSRVSIIPSQVIHVIFLLEKVIHVII